MLRHHIREGSLIDCYFIRFFQMAALISRKKVIEIAELPTQFPGEPLLITIEKHLLFSWTLKYHFSTR